MASWESLGDRAIRLARPAAPARAIVRAARAWPGVVDVVVARDMIAVYFDGEPVVDEGRVRALAALSVEPDEPVRDHVLAARYAGEDLHAVARAAGLAAAEVVQLHADAVYTVETMGFAPGFAYLAGLDPRLHLPRRATPRPRVPAGSLAIAGAHTAVYPFDSPGGWHVIGQLVDEPPLFDERGARLGLGDRVRFRVVA